MRLAEVFAVMGPLLRGRMTHAEAARRLYGGRAESLDGQRLALYAELGRAHRFEAVDHVFRYAREAIIREQGAEAWARIVEAYFAAWPMRHVEINQNGAELPEFLDEEARTGRVPAWIAELADFEWWEWTTLVALDAAEDERPDEGPLRIASTVELRPYAHDLVGWIDERDRAGTPEPGERLVLFFRDRDLDVRRADAAPMHLGLLRAGHTGQPMPAGAQAAAVAATLMELIAAGVLLGRG